MQVSSDGGASWADVTTSTASTWSYTDPTTHGTSFTYQARIVDAAGNVGANTASQAVTIDTAAPTAPSISSIPENSGGGINAGEASDGTPVVVGLAGTGAAAGDTLTIDWGSQTVNYTLLAGDISGNSATVTVPLATIAAQGQGTFNVTASADRRGGQRRPQLDGDLGDGRHVGADGGGCDHRDCHRQRHVVERLCHQRHDADGIGHARRARRRREGAGQQRRRRQLGRCTTSTASTWSYTDPTTHGTSFIYQARIVDAAGNVGANTASQAVTIDTAAPAAPSISSIPENSGGGINAGEASDGTPVVVGLAGTGAVAGDTLTINWGGQTVNYTLLAGDISGNSATVTVPLATIAAQGNGTFNVTARLTDAAGNAGPNSTATSVTVDTSAPTAEVAITAIATDSGTSSSDYVTNDTTLTVSGTHGAARHRREGAGQQRRRRQLGRCHHQHGQHLELYRSRDARHELHLPGADRRHRGQCRCQHRQPGGDHRHGGADGAVDQLDPGESAAASTPARPRTARRWWWAWRAPGRWRATR